jgi:hypothetical protein
MIDLLNTTAQSNIPLAALPFAIPQFDDIPKSFQHTPGEKIEKYNTHSF